MAALENEYKPLVVGWDQWEKTALYVWPMASWGSTLCREVSSEKEGIDFMESVTQNQTLKHQSDLEMQGEEEFPPRGDFSSPQRAPVLVPRRALGGLKWLCWADREGRVMRKQTLHSGSIPKFMRIPGNQYPSSMNMINCCISVSHFHPITYFLHIWKAIESNLGM